MLLHILVYHHPPSSSVLALFSFCRIYDFFTWNPGDFLEALLYCMSNTSLVWKHQYNIIFKFGSWSFFHFYTKRSLLFSPALLLFKLWLVQSSWEIQTNQDDEPIDIPFAFAFQNCWSRRVTMPIPLSLIDEPIVYLL